MDEQKKPPRTNGMGWGRSMGMPAGVIVGLALGNITLGLASGPAFGVPLGAELEATNRKGAGYSKKHLWHTVEAFLVVLIVAIIASRMIRAT